MVFLGGERGNRKTCLVCRIKTRWTSMVCARAFVHSGAVVPNFRTIVALGTGVFETRNRSQFLQTILEVGRYLLRISHSSGNLRDTRRQWARDHPRKMASILQRSNTQSLGREFLVECRLCNHNTRRSHFQCSRLFRRLRWVRASNFGWVRVFPNRPCWIVFLR